MNGAASSSSIGNFHTPGAGIGGNANTPTRCRTGGYPQALSTRAFSWLIGAWLLFWLLTPTAAFAQSGIGIGTIAADDIVDALEKWEGFVISGFLSGPGNANRTVTVTINPGTLQEQVMTATTDSTGLWTVSVPAHADYITEADDQTVHVELGTLSHTRTFGADLRLPLSVDVAGDDVINAFEKADGFDIIGKAIGVRPGTPVYFSGVTLTATIDGVDVGSGLTGSLGTGTVAVTSSESAAITEPSATVAVTASRSGYTDATVSRTVTVDLTVDGPGVVDHPENDTALATYTASGISGTLTWNLSGDDSGDFDIGADGALTFADPPDYEDPGDADTDNEYLVTVRALDDGSVAGTLDVTVGVTNVNEPPVVSGRRRVTRAEDAPLAVHTYTASDPENDPLTWDLSGDDAGDFEISDGVLSFKASPDYEAPGDADADNQYSVTVEASDDGGLTGTRDVTVTVRGVDEPPVLTGYTAITYAEHATRPVHTYRATDPEGATITWTLAGDDAGHFEISDGVLSFDTPPVVDSPNDADADNVYRVTVQASDGSLTATLDVSVTVVMNRPPVWSGDAARTFSEDGSGEEVTFTLSDADGDGAIVAIGAKPGDKDAGPLRIITYTLDSDTLEGHVAVNFRDGLPDFENPTDSDGDNVYEITLRAMNEGVVGAGSWVEQPVAITVTNADETPIARDDAVNTDEDTPVVIAVLDNDFVDAAATPLDVETVGTPSNGSATLDADSDTVTYTPNANYHGTDTFSYTVSDGANRTDTGTVTVTVASVNDAPVAVVDDVRTKQNAPLVIDVLANDTDADTDDTLTVSAVGIPKTGTAAVNSDGTVTYTPDFNSTDPDTFTYTVSDGTVTATGTVNVTIEAASQNANLSGLTISPGTLTFAAGTTAYTVDAAANVSSVTVTPTTADAGATVTVNGTAVARGSASAAIALVAEGAVMITVRVTAEDTTTTETYTVTVLKPRTGDPRLSFRQRLGPDYAFFSRTFDETQEESCLTTPSEEGCPADHKYYRYTASASSNTAEIRFQADSNHTGVDYSVEEVSGNNQTSKTGSVESTTRLTAGAWTSFTLTPGKVTNVWITTDAGLHTVTEISTCYVADLDLAGLTMQAGGAAVTLHKDDGSGTTGFADDVGAYTASVANTVKSVTATPTLPANGCPTVTVDGAAVAGGSASGAIRLEAGTATSIPVVFTSGPDQVAYTIAVSRAADLQPSFAADSVADQAYKVNDEITQWTLPAATVRWFTR